MPERFFVPGVGTQQTILLAGEEAHHLVRVRHLGRGDRVQLFDGSGMEWEAEVDEVDRQEVRLSVFHGHLVDRELPFPLTLACSPPKGDRLRWLVEKATELGVTRFVPLETERAVRLIRGLRADKMRRWVIEASKQCGRNVLMEVADPVRWTAYLDSVSTRVARFLADPTGESVDLASGDYSTTGIAIAVGPEGGFTEGELQVARRGGWQPVSLGPRTLRIETAALATVARLTASISQASPK